MLLFVLLLSYGIITTNQAPGLPPYDPVHDRAGESGLPYGWWWSITGAVPMPGEGEDLTVAPPATWHGLVGNCMTLYRNVSNHIVWCVRACVRE